jgi:hypothetical protein
MQNLKWGMILSFREEGNELKCNDYTGTQASLANVVSLLFPESLSFWKINCYVSFSDPELLESIIRIFTMIQLGKGSMYRSSL